MCVFSFKKKWMHQRLERQRKLDKFCAYQHWRLEHYAWGQASAEKSHRGSREEATYASER